mgnify:CR=1 FL=1
MALGIQLGIVDKTLSSYFLLTFLLYKNGSICRWDVGFKLEKVGMHVLVVYRDMLDCMKDDQVFTKLCS